GPLADFAMVVPVPVVLHDGDVKTLKPEVFAHVESLGSPRLVEYWEQDPCPVPLAMDEGVGYGSLGSVAYGAGGGYGTIGAGHSTVKIEAKFDVAEYKILILSATDSAGLETWLHDNDYKIPAGAEPLLRPYIEGGSKFFVAKVDPAKVRLVDGHAALSPLRFHYDSDEFTLPIRLGMANSSGKQDLIVNIISPSKRYEVANYKNAFIPTNIDVKNNAKARFAEFYASLFDETVKANPGAVITEYAWTSQGSPQCDPCPTVTMTSTDLDTLGGDVIKADLGDKFVMTRLHARYGKKDMKDDLRFKEAKAVTGGREEWTKKGIELGANPSEENFFQARYAIRHWWTGPIKCKNPRRGVWGGPWDDVVDDGVTSAQKLAFVKRGNFQLGTAITRDIWEIGFKKAAPPPKQPAPVINKAQVQTQTKKMGLGAIALLLIALGAIRWKRRA
ncbi:MAG TPA: DUF2330 domain-containing protein, partial [Kofleriaceae bacterium]|nr:DUF2330 domain-containing protein [Kofleriaceae bacterium]